MDWFNKVDVDGSGADLEIVSTLLGTVVSDRNLTEKVFKTNSVCIRRT